MDLKDLAEPNSLTDGNEDVVDDESDAPGWAAGRKRRDVHP